MVAERLLKLAAEFGACNVWVAGGMKPRIMVNKQIMELDYPDISEKEAEKILFDIMDDSLQESYRRDKSVDFVLDIKSAGRFRIHIYERMGYPAGCIKVITPFYDFECDDEQLRNLCSEEQGIIIIAGRQGSGKTTTLAMMADMITSERPVHLMTLEKPIEQKISNGVGIVSRREIGRDTADYLCALKDIVHEAVDVLVIGELDSPQAAYTAVQAAKMGCLVLTTMNSANALTVKKQFTNILRQSRNPFDSDDLKLIKAVVYQRLSYGQAGNNVKAEREILR